MSKARKNLRQGTWINDSFRTTLGIGEAGSVETFASIDQIVWSHTTEDSENMGRGKKHWGTIDGSGFIEWLCYQFVKKYCAAWCELELVDSADLFTFFCASWPMFKGEITT
jgi:hypothetical protein